MAAAIDMFNTKLAAFLEDIIQAVPECAEFRTLRTGVQLATQFDKTTAQALFHQTVAVPYGDHITRKDEAFFLNETYEGATKAAGLDINIVDKLKAVWGKLDAGSQQAIWQHLQVLLVLSRRVAGAK